MQEISSFNEEILGLANFGDWLNRIGVICRFLIASREKKLPQIDHLLCLVDTNGAGGAAVDECLEVINVFF